MAYSYREQLEKIAMMRNAKKNNGTGYIWDYARDGGCGNARCNNGWVYSHGTEYPCGACKRISEAKKK